MDETSRNRGAEARTFLTRLWHLDNDERPGFLIGDLGGKVTGGRSVKSALFSTDGAECVRDRLLDPRRFLQAQLAEIEGMLKLRGDYVPALCPALGVVGIPSAFGCEVVWWENDFPAVRPRIGGDPEDVAAFRQPAPTDGELRRVLDYIDHFIAATAGSFPIRMGDIQGPLDSAALVLGHTTFLPALYTHPDAMHKLLGMVTDLTIAFVREQRALVKRQGVEFIPSMFQPWMPDGFGVSISNDECALISAELHDEFSVPYLNRLAEEFGGVYVHSCGRWAHQIPSLKKVKDLRGLEFGASEAPYGPILEAFSGKTVLAARVGHHREVKFNGMADFIRRLRAAARTNRGLMIHVDITNGMVDDTWPSTDLKEIYRLVGAE